MTSRQLPVSTVGTPVKFIPLFFAALAICLHAAGGERKASTRRPLIGGLMPATKAFVRARRESVKKQPMKTYRDFSSRGRDLPTQVNLLTYLDYVPAERNQGYTGTCYLWAGTACAALDLSINEGVKDRFSTQFAISYMPFVLNKDPFDGGFEETVDDFYLRTGFFVPWSNKNASFDPDMYAATVFPYMIGTEKRYYVNDMTSSELDVYEDQASAITTIKSALADNKPISFSFGHSAAGWTRFGAGIVFPPFAKYDTYWNTGDDTPWNFKSSDGQSYIEDVEYFAFHATTCVGYDDPQGDGTGYWIILNSWGTAWDTRPDGTFKVAMDIDYDATGYVTDSDGTKETTTCFGFSVFDIDWADNLTSGDESREDLMLFNLSLDSQKQSFSAQARLVDGAFPTTLPSAGTLQISTYPAITYTCDSDHGEWKERGKYHSYSSRKGELPKIQIKYVPGGQDWEFKLSKATDLYNAVDPVNGVGATLTLGEGDDATDYPSSFVVFEDMPKTKLNAKK